MSSSRAGLGLGVVVGLVSLAVLAGNLFEMHNRLSATVCVLLPYVAVADRLTGPPNALMVVVTVWSLVQMPVYGWLIGRDRARRALSPATALLGSLHVAMAAYALSIKGGYLPPPTFTR